MGTAHDGAQVCREVCRKVCRASAYLEAARPHQHWVFGGAPSPTTRPPRERKVGGLRVVGLGTFFLEKMAGAGGESWVDWNRCWKRWRLDRGGN